MLWMLGTARTCGSLWLARAHLTRRTSENLKECFVAPCCMMLDVTKFMAEFRCLFRLFLGTCFLILTLCPNSGGGCVKSGFEGPVSTLMASRPVQLDSLGKSIWSFHQPPRTPQIPDDTRHPTRPLEAMKQAADLLLSQLLDFPARGWVWCDRSD